MGNKFADLPDTFGKQSGGIFAFHQRQYFIGTRLQREVKMGHNYAGISYQLNDFIFQQVWLDGPQPEPVQPLHIFQRFQ